MTTKEVKSEIKSAIDDKFSREEQLRYKLRCQNMGVLILVGLIGFVLALHKSVIWDEWLKVDYPDMCNRIYDWTVSVSFNILDVYPTNLYNILNNVVSSAVLFIGLMMIAISLGFLLMMEMDENLIPSRDIFGTKEEVHKDLKIVFTWLLGGTKEYLDDLKEKPVEYDEYTKIMKAKEKATNMTNSFTKKKAENPYKIKYVCPNCNQSYFLKEDFDGFVPNCKNCGAVMESKN